MDSIVYTKIIKPLSDRVGALLLLILFSPFIMMTAFLILFSMGRPIFFTQQRPGHHRKNFTIYKFRTMTDDKDESGKLLPDTKRLKGVGKLIRSLSLDELPQLINVLCGEMSFIGPRPLLIEYLDLYSPEQAMRHNVKPGISGWAQVNGRNAISWKKKFEYDLWYVNHLSFFLDMKILWMTVKNVLNRNGINQNEHITMEKFNGQN